jgi:hypothetical protein
VLAKRLAAHCTHERRDVVDREAAAVIEWALKHLDAPAVDDCIGRVLAEFWPAQPRRPGIIRRTVTRTYK